MVDTALDTGYLCIGTRLGFWAPRGQVKSDWQATYDLAVVRVLGRTGSPNVRMMVPVFTRRSPRWTIIFLTFVIQCAAKFSSKIPTSYDSLLEFIFRCGTTFIGQFASTVERSKQSEWLFLGICNEVSRSEPLYWYCHSSQAFQYLFDDKGV